jgi:2-hydroxy-3-oxopropionate reductase
MAGRLLAAGYEVMVFDTNKTAVAALVEAGAKAADTPAVLAAGADIVLLSLPTPDIVKAVALGADGLENGGGVRIVVDLSTTGPRVTREVAAGLSKAGIVMVDCPVSGGVAGAENGRLALMAAGAPDAFAEVEAILLHLGKTYYVGAEPGMGQMIKLINNLMSVTSLTIASEALVLGAKAGLDPEVMLNVINAGTGSTNATLDKIPKYVIGRSFNFGFPIELSVKDMRLCLDESEALGVPMVVGTAVQQMVKITRGRLGASADLTEIIRPIEEWAGITVGETKRSDA